MTIRATDNTADRLLIAAVATSGPDAIRAIALAYRAFANEHPGQDGALLLPPAAHDNSVTLAQNRVVDEVEWNAFPV